MFLALMSLIFCSTFGTLAVADTRVQISRFSSFESFQAALEFNYVKKSGSQVFTPARGITIHDLTTCESLLHAFQKFPLQKMIDVGLLSASQAEGYSKLAENLKPSQVTLFSKMITSPDANRVTFEDEQRLASIFSVSNFSLDTQARSIVHTRLPIELEASWTTVLKLHLPDEKRFMLWELGRAAQDGAQELDELIQTSVLGMLHEAISNALMLGFNSEEVVNHGLVIVHAKSRAHEVAYRRRHPTARIIRHPLEDNDMVFLIPLREMIAKYHPEKISTLYTSLIEATDHKIGVSQAVGVSNYLKLYKWYEADHEYIGLPQYQSRSPLAFSPAAGGSVLTNHYTSGMLQEFGVPADKIAGVIRAFSSHSYDLMAYAPGRYNDVTESELVMPHYNKNNAFEISNLDSTLSLEDPYYIRAVLAGGQRYWGMLLSGHLSNQYNFDIQQFQEVSNTLHTSGYRIGITTTNPKVSAAIKALGPIASEQVSANIVGGESMPPYTKDAFAFLQRGLNATYYMHFFTIEQVRKFGVELGQAGALRFNFKPTATNSEAQLQSALSNPNFF